VFPTFEDFLGKLSSHDHFKKTSVPWIKLDLVTIWANVHISLRIATSYVQPDNENHFYQNFTLLSSSPTAETSTEILTLMRSSYLLVGGVGYCAKAPLMDPLSNPRIR